MQRSLAALILASQILFTFASTRHYDLTTGQQATLAGLFHPEAVSVSQAVPADTSHHSPATCPICLAQNLGRGLAAISFFPVVSGQIISDVLQDRVQSSPSGTAPLPRSRAPPTLS